ncbi:MAG: hypothetical protein SFY81_11475 [Verrucomicrobiota bacterium]|nr:hypothetical protein [Verrucomicrobiota bacterium]
MPKETSTVHANSNYYSIFLLGVNLNRDDQWSSRNDIALTAKLTVQGQEIDVPVYQRYDKGVDGRLGIINYPLLTTIPAVGDTFQVGIEIVRRNKNDPLKKAIDFLTKSGGDSRLTTYAAHAVPYITLIGSVAKDLYTAFGPPAEGDLLFKMNPVGFSPAEGNDNAGFLLHDTIIILYKGSSPAPAGMITYSEEGGFADPSAYLRTGQWVALRIRKHNRRHDYHKRLWHTRYNQGIAALPRAKDSASIQQIEAILNEARILLRADEDFTVQDKLKIENEWDTAIAAAKSSLLAGNSKALEDALRRAVTKPSKINPQLGAADSSSLLESSIGTQVKDIQLFKPEVISKQLSR